MLFSKSSEIYSQRVSLVFVKFQVTAVRHQCVVEMDIYSQQQGSTRTCRSEPINSTFHSSYREDKRQMITRLACLPKKKKNLRAAEFVWASPCRRGKVLGGCVKEQSYTRRERREVHGGWSVKQRGAQSWDRELARVVDAV